VTTSPHSPDSTPDSTPDVDPNIATPSLDAWKVLMALITLGVVTGAFLALFGHSLRLFG
jgi:hypothetical protein